MIINHGQVQLAGDIEELLGSHHLLVGPRLSNGQRPPGVEIVREQHAERLSSLWVRGQRPALPPEWRAEPLPLEELVIAYLSEPEAAALPAPRLVEQAG
jgi:ABC-2 type transport system ATP-binding protein